MEIRLKLKYRIGGTAPKFNKHSDNNGPKKRHKLSGVLRDRENAITLRNRPVKHLLGNGKVRWERNR